MIEQSKTNRIGRVNSLIQQLLGEILRVYLEEVNALVTVSKVEASKSLKWAKVWISIFGGDDKQIMNTIQSNIYHIQGELNRRLAIRPLPRLQFFLDTSPRHAQHIDELIEKIHKEEGEN